MIKPFEEVYKLDSITMNLTNNCNLRCVYCFEQNKSVHRDMMSPHLAIDVIDKAYSTHYVNPNFRNKYTINFFGGEPFLNWDAMKAVVDFCAKNNYDVSYGVTTNLTILTDEMLQYIEDHSIFLLVSIDGTKEIHDRNRSNSYDRVIANIKKLQDRGLSRYIESRMTIMPEDAKYMFESTKSIIEMGIDNVCPMPVTDVEWSESTLNDYRENFRKLIEYYLEITNKEDYNRNISIKNINDVLTNVLAPEVSDEMLCAIFNNRWCAVDTNGDIYPCHQLPTSTEEIKKKNYIGNIYTGVEEDMIVKTPKKVTYYKDECDTCNARGTCKGGCPQENFRLNQREDQPSEAYCDLRKIIAEEVKSKQKEIMNSPNLRSRQLVLLKENLKIKDYIDLLFNDTNLRDTLTASTRLMKVKEMINNLGEEKILPTFKDYFEQKLVIMASVVVTENKMRQSEALGIDM